MFMKKEYILMIALRLSREYFLRFLIIYLFLKLDKIDNVNLVKKYIYIYIENKYVYLIFIFILII